MSTADEILKAEKPNDDNGWIEYCILKMWEECSVADEYITDNAAAELSALRARVEALEENANKLLGLALSFNEEDPWIFKRNGGVEIVSNAQAFLNPEA